MLGVFGAMSVGRGGSKPNLCNFGADQYDVTMPREARQQVTFFSWYCWAINLGAVVVYCYIVTLATSGSGAIPKEYGFFATYMIAGCSMGLGFIVFVAGSSRYMHKPPGGDSLRGLCQYLWASARTSAKGAVAFSGWVALVAFLALSVVQAFVIDNNASAALSYAALGLAAHSCMVLSVCHMRNGSIRKGIPGHQLENNWLSASDAAATLDAVPVMLVVNLGLALVFNCANGYMGAQACQMDLRIGSTQINGAFFTVADCGAVILVIPILESIGYPAVARLKKSEVTRSQRIVAGLAVAVMAALACVCIEYARRAAPVLKEVRARV